MGIPSRVMSIAVCGAVALGGCGGKASSPSTSTAAPAPPAASTGSRGCRDVNVPGHRAVEITASGIACAKAERVAAAAEGRGRAPYVSGGFSCRGTEASGGDTTYRCSNSSARITFLYGSA